MLGETQLPYSDFNLEAAISSCSAGDYSLSVAIFNSPMFVWFLVLSIVVGYVVSEVGMFRSFYSKFTSV